jgi:hypothetical protein
MEHPISLTNPGAETGDTTGWTVSAGTITSNTGTISNSGGLSARSGSRYFRLGTSSGGSHTSYQDIVVDSGLEAAIDAGDATTVATVWFVSVNYKPVLTLEFYDGSASLLDTETITTAENRFFWKQLALDVSIPATTRTIRFKIGSTPETGQSGCYFDDLTLVISDSLSTKNQQTVVYAVASHIADNIQSSQEPVLVVSAAEESSGEYLMYGHQFVAYALVRGFGDRRQLRAWTFTQDDHDFYVINLGTAMTLVFDKLSGRWAQWRSPSYNYWRGEDGCSWESYNLCCDPLSGKIWKIDAEGRLDYTTTPITSMVTGQLTLRGRDIRPCYMAELAVSEGQLTSGLEGGDVYFQLRTNDGINWYDHGQVPGQDIGEDITVRWYGLGIMKAPGVVFEITDTGYARRIDGFNIEVGQ